MDPADELHRDRARTRSRLASLRADHAAVVESSEGSNLDDEHDPEGHTIAFERSQMATLVRQAEHHLAEVEAALQRLAAGGYGRCERCGEPVAPARLEARPAARTCIGCARS